MDTAHKITNNLPLVSIIMLTYNRAKYISEAIDSVLIQTYKNFELFIIDDGSTDNTKEILSLYRDPRINIIFHSKNEGLHVRRTESLTYPNGKYTAIIDSDDIWVASTKLAEQVNYMEQNVNYAVVGTFLLLINNQGKNIGQNEYQTKDTDIRNHILNRNQFVHSGVLIRTEILRKVSGYRDTGLAEDLDLFLQLGTVGKFANIPKYMTAYRIHTESFNSQKLTMAKAVLNIIKQYKNDYPFYYFALIKCHLRIWYLYLFC